MTKTLDELMALADECFVLGDLGPIRSALRELIADAERMRMILSEAGIVIHETPEGFYWRQDDAQRTKASE